jgi:hypothetical protein
MVIVLRSEICALLTADRTLSRTRFQFLSLHPLLLEIQAVLDLGPLASDESLPKKMDEGACLAIRSLA